jgi:serine/threonine protein kinase/tetratricopeptide (TPR) repeat protein
VKLPERYRVLQVLGEGATCEVLLAEDLARQEPVALKIVRANLALHDRFRVRFAREVSLLANVAHPHIVPVHDLGMLDDGRPFVSMAYADQGSFGDLLRTRPPIVTVLKIIDQVLDALACLHARGLVHQDLKPDNVLLRKTDDEGVMAWVADLGVAGARAELGMEGRSGLPGTPLWMAPEQLYGSVAELGPWTDLYSVGLMLYEVLGGDPPAEESRAKLLKYRTAGVPEMPWEMPDAVCHVVSNLLDPEPCQRYDRAADVRRALSAVTQELNPDQPAQSVFVDFGSEEPRPMGTTTTFPDVILAEAQEPLTVPSHESVDPMSVPRWNRVAPGSFPIEPPEDWENRVDPNGLSLLPFREFPLTGRGPIRRQIWDLASKVLTTREPKIVLLIGRAGTGKSQILSRLSRALDEGGYMEVMALRYNNPASTWDGYRGAVQELLHPWSDSRATVESRLCRWLGRDQQASSQSVRAESQVMARWCGYAEKNEDPVNDAVGLAFLYRHLDARAWRGGACLVLEDAHLASAQGDGLDIAEALLEHSVGTRPVLCLVSLSREAIEADASLASRIESLQNLGADTIEVERLSLTQTETHLRDGLGLEPALAHAIAPGCLGSPVYVSMLIRDWAARGLLSPTRRGLSLDPTTSLDDALELDLDTLAERRIEGALSQLGNRLLVERSLAMAALVGPEPPFFVIREVGEQGLNGLLSLGLVGQRGARLVFEHGRIWWAARRMAEDRLDVERCHRALADAWKKLGDSTGMNVDHQVGEHRLYGGQIEAAVMPLLRAGRQAMAEGRPGHALAASRLALKASDGTDTLVTRAEARRRVAEALLELERPDEALEMIDEAQDLGGLDRRSVAELNLVAARAAISQGRVEPGRKLLLRSGRVFEALRDWRGQVEASHGQGLLHRMEGKPESAVRHFEEMLERNRGRDKQFSIRGLVGLVEARVSAGLIEGVEPWLDQLRTLARDSGDTRYIAQAAYAAGLLYLRQGRLESCRRHFLTARALAATLGADRMRLACENNLGEVYRYAGVEEQAGRAYERAARLSEDRGWKDLAAVAHQNLALLALKRGDEDGARASIRVSEALLQNHPRHWGWLFVGLMRALWAAEEGDERGCRAWWSVAKERGLGRLEVPDIYPVLCRMERAAEGSEWRDIARQSREIRQMLERTMPSLVSGNKGLGDER